MASLAILARPTVMTSSTELSPTMRRTTASVMSRKVVVASLILKRKLYGSLILYWTIHSVTTTFRSPVSMTDSALVSALLMYSDWMPGFVVRKPNSSLSWRWTGTRVSGLDARGEA